MANDQTHRYQTQVLWTFFQSQNRAVAYDAQTAKLAPIFDVLYFLMGSILADLPTDARFLCVGVGTGTGNSSNLLKPFRTGTLRR
jgi:hypothetical protein